jgi:hypothetical protein
METPRTDSPGDSAPPAALLMGTLCAALVSQAVAVAATLGVADRLVGGARHVDEIAADVGVDAGALGRLLRTLAAAGIFSEISPGSFANSPQSELLRWDVPGSLRDISTWVGVGPHWEVYGRMLDAVRSGAPQWEAVHGSELFPFLFGSRPELGALFNRAMASFSTTTIPAVVAAMDLSTASLVADIGGGSGHLLAALLKRHRAMRGVLFDTAGGLDGAPACLAAHGVAERVTVAAGDFAAAVPVVADVYVLKHVIHDWNDERAETILRNVRKAMPAHARLLLVEMVITPGNLPHFGKICDLDMLVSVGGRERTAEEFRSLLASAGLSMVRIVPTASIVSIVEAVPDEPRV